MDITTRQCTKCGFDLFNDFFPKTGSVCKACKSVGTKPGYIYLISSPGSNRYKVGTCTGTREDLIKRYKTYLPDVEILRYTLVAQAYKAEKQIHSSLAAYHIGGEWFEVDEATAHMKFDAIAEEYGFT
jgi:hypothetical protein